MSRLLCQQVGKTFKLLYSRVINSIAGGQHRVIWVQDANAAQQVYMSIRKD